MNLRVRLKEKSGSEPCRSCSLFPRVSSVRSRSRWKSTDNNHSRRRRLQHIHRPVLMTAQCACPAVHVLSAACWHHGVWHPPPWLPDNGKQTSLDCNIGERQQASRALKHFKVRVNSKLFADTELNYRRKSVSNNKKMVYKTFLPSRQAYSNKFGGKTRSV